MYKDFRIVVVTPAGRRRYLELLIPQIKRYKGVVDEYRLWVNTGYLEDIEFMREQADKDPEFIKLEFLPPHVHCDGNFSIRNFFKNCQDPNTIYVRFDDDIVYLDTVDAFTRFLDFRISHPEYFLVYPTILNNAIITHLLQRMGKLNLTHGFSGYLCMDDIGWNSPLFSENVHRQILEKPSLDFYRMNVNWQLVNYERVSINCISWFGSEFAKFDAEVGRDEEQWLATDKPQHDQKMNCINGDFVCVHYAYFTQRNHLDATDVLPKYKEKLTTLGLI